MVLFAFGIDLVINWCKKAREVRGFEPYCFHEFFNCLNDPQFPHAYYLCITRATSVGPVKLQNDHFTIVLLMFDFFVVLIFKKVNRDNICEVSEKFCSSSNLFSTVKLYNFLDSLKSILFGLSQIV